VRPVHRVELGRHIDDAAPTLLYHTGCDAARHLVGGNVVGLDDRLHDVVRHLPEFLRFGAAEARRVDRRKGQPGIVDENLRVAKALLRHRDDAVALGRPAQIGDERQDMSRKIAPRGRRRDVDDIAVDVADREHRMPFAREPECHCPAEAAQPAGDDCDPSLHRSLPVAMGQIASVPVIQAEFGRILDLRCSRKRRTAESGSSRIACA